MVVDDPIVPEDKDHEMTDTKDKESESTGTPEEKVSEDKAEDTAPVISNTGSETTDKETDDTEKITEHTDDVVVIDTKASEVQKNETKVVANGAMKSTDPVQTGDTSNAAGFGATLLASMTAIGAVLFRRKKEAE